MANTPALSSNTDSSRRACWCRIRKHAHVVHELALMESVVDAVLDQVPDARIAVVRLEIGELAGVTVDAMQFGFDICTAGTPLAGARLDIVAIAARARCRECSGEQAISAYGLPCTCGSFDRELICGDEIRLKEVEVH